MTGTAARYLYLARHGEASADESELTDNGRRQASLLGERLRNSPLTAIHHGPLARAEQTAQLIHDQLDGVPLQRSELAGDYIPYLPQREELPSASADAMLGFLSQFPAEEREHGPQLAQEALARFTGPVEYDEPRHELVVTHNHANAGLTVIRYAPGRPASVLFYNDMGHLPAPLRWTGFPPDTHI